MENLTLGNFQQKVKSLLRDTVREHLKSIYPSPVEILETIDDIGLDWTDDGGECLVSFHDSEGFTILRSEFSTPEGERVLPNLRDIHGFGRYLDENAYCGFYKITLSHTQLKRGRQYWSEIVSKIIGRLQNEYGVRWNHSNRSFWVLVDDGQALHRQRVVAQAKFGIDSVTYTSNNISVTVPIDKLHSELTKISRLEFRIKVLKNPKT